MKKKQSIWGDLLDALLEFVFVMVCFAVGIGVFVAFDVDISQMDGELLIGIGAIIVLAVVFACIGCIKLLKHLRAKQSDKENDYVR